jgi:hypothetical protein
MNTVSKWLCVGLIVLCLPASAMAAGAAFHKPAQQTYATPDEAVAALVDAARHGNARQLEAVLGPGSGKLINSGDAIADTESRARFLNAYDQQHKLVPSGTDRMTLDVGPNAWPMPIPLVKSGDRWHFETMAGAQEIIDRRIGRNEIAAISSCLAYVEAQKAYHALTEKRGQPQYAQRLISTKGKQNGLYWPAAAGQEPSPMAEFVAQAIDEGYPLDIVESPLPLHGYHYRILTAQGPDAPGGAVSYLDQGEMTGGFALVAWPARYGASGIMTFIVGSDGIVYQKDLGPQTGKLAGSMRAYNPDVSWARVDVVAK